MRALSVATLARRVGGVVVLGALLIASWPMPFRGLAAPTPDPTSVAARPSQEPPSMTPQPPTASPAPTLIPTLAEECDGSLGPDWHPLHLGTDPGFGLDSDFLGSLAQVSVESGVCRIRAERMATPSGRPYASAAITTKDRFSQRYGTFEIRVRYPGGQGVWPAFWLLEQREDVASPPEIDIFEAYPAISPGHSPGLVTSTLHFAGGSEHVTHDAREDLTKDFHVHRLTWSPGLLVFSLDGIETGRITTSVPDVAMYPIVNLAVGAPGFRANASTPDVATMEIDYIRVWSA